MRQSALILSLVAAAGTAHATDRSWNNTLGGSASTASNWTPAGVPAAADALTFNLTSNYPTSFNAATAASTLMTFKRGQVTLSFSAPHSTGAGFTVGDQSGDNATATITTGTLTVNGAAFVGDETGSQGTLRVNDSDARFIVAGGADLTVGRNGTGTLAVTGGGFVSVADQIIAGSNTTSVSTVTASGFVLNPSYTRSTIETQSTGDSRLGQGGDATVIISNGALARFGGNLIVANGTASTSTVTIETTGLQPATLEVGGDLLIGRNTSNAIAAGNGTVDVRGGGSLAVGDLLSVSGDPDGGTGLFRLASGGRVETRSLLVGQGGTMELNGGTLDIRGGTLSDSGAPANLVIAGADRPVVTLRDGAAASLGTNGITRSTALMVGGGIGAGHADFDVRGGSSLSVTFGNIIIGENTDDTGGMIISGSGSTLTTPATSAIVVGSSGEGRFEAELGGTVNAGMLFIARLIDSGGVALFENPGTTATFERVFVGGNTTFAGGPGTLIVNHHAVLNVTAAASSLVVRTGGTLDVVNATVNTPGTIRVEGTCRLQPGGNITCGVFDLSGGTLTGHPGAAGSAAVLGEIITRSGSIIRAEDCDLTLGDAGSSSGFAAEDGSTIMTGARRITLLDATISPVNHITLGGGVLACPAGAFMLLNSQITGQGTLEGAWNLGVGTFVTATGLGIRFNGRVERSAGTMTGTVFRFLPGSEYRGSNDISARVDFQSGSKLKAIADITMGVASNPSGVVFDGEMDVNDEIITLFDLDGVALGHLTSIEGGEIACATPLSLAFGRTLIGHGTLRTPHVTIAGDVFTGLAPGLPESWSVHGGVTFTHRASYTCEFMYSFEGPPQHDLLHAFGPVVVGGTLNASLIPGYVPQRGDRITLIRGTSRTGTFGAENVPPGWHVIYDTNSVDVYYLCVADFNDDGGIDGSDVQAFYTEWEEGNFLADVNLDGGVDGADVETFFALWEAGLCA